MTRQTLRRARQVLWPVRQGREAASESGKCARDRLYKLKMRTPTCPPTSVLLTLPFFFPPIPISLQQIPQAILGALLAEKCCFSVVLTF